MRDLRANSTILKPHFPGYWRKEVFTDQHNRSHKSRSLWYFQAKNIGFRKTLTGIPTLDDSTLLHPKMCKSGASKPFCKWPHSNILGCKAMQPLLQLFNSLLSHKSNHQQCSNRTVLNDHQDLNFLEFSHYKIPLLIFTLKIHHLNMQKPFLGHVLNKNRWWTKSLPTPELNKQMVLM